jgi:hypothetical protein
VFERITPAEVWACTTCRACDEVCPVHIEILDKILDMRRYLSLMESDFPSSVGTMYRSLENQENPWGISNRDRGQWAEGLPEQVPIVDGTTVSDHEYLYWVGCAGSFDDKNKKVTQAVAKLLIRAGVDFAILGPSERCNGDPARRSGNEYLYQMLATANVEMLNGIGATKIFVQCPHCFNTLGIPPAGRRLRGHPPLPAPRAAHRQRPTGPGRRHPCRTGRLPRQLLPRPAQRHLRPAPESARLPGRHRHRRIAPLPGRGSVLRGRRGPHVMEESGTKVNVDRSQELIDTGASRIATACPFCLIMLDDGTKASQRDDIIVADISIHLLDAIESAEGDQTPPAPPSTHIPAETPPAPPSTHIPAETPTHTVKPEEPCHRRRRS